MKAMAKVPFTEFTEFNLIFLAYFVLISLVSAVVAMGKPSIGSLFNKKASVSKWWFFIPKISDIGLDLLE